MSDEAPPTEQPAPKRAYTRRPAGTIRRSYRRRTKDATAGIASAAVANAQDQAEPAREASSLEPRTRISREQRDVGAFELPRHRRKPGWDYQFWPMKVMGMPVDGSEMAAIHNGGWRPEHARDWPELVVPGTPDNKYVDIQNLRLFSRPMALTREAKQEDYDAAVRQQRDRIVGAFEGRAEGGLSDVRGVRAHGLQLDIEGEAGTHSERRR